MSDEDLPQGWRDMVWKLTQKAKEADKRASVSAQSEAMYIADYLRRQAADILGNAMAGRGTNDRCDVAAEALEMAAEVIESGDYRK